MSKQSFGNRLPKRDATDYAGQADDLLAYVGTLDPSWGEKIRITREETGYTSLQMIGAWIGYTLDSGTHLIHPAHPFFETGFNAAGSSKECPACGKTFAVRFAGQECCGDECWNVHHGVHRTQVVKEPVPVETPLPEPEPDVATLTD